MAGRVVRWGWSAGRPGTATRRSGSATGWTTGRSAVGQRVCQVPVGNLINWCGYYNAQELVESRRCHRFPVPARRFVVACENIPHPLQAVLLERIYVVQEAAFKAPASKAQRGDQHEQGQAEEREYQLLGEGESHHANIAATELQGHPVFRWASTSVQDEARMWRESGEKAWK